ncbi:hypothetical protein [Pseudomonas kitaguniensis]|uniref:DUF4296 domain-containing protein n=1 Tax=Pseudomonas kitaguniensis TaxID=2607908 RepID=A0A5N7KIU5_9PSED|nr:hypothetical protein [Pseudomonas kitaguniensis]MPR02133.1 hypothetical protein [Pseudomonas kitaguniensis]
MRAFAMLLAFCLTAGCASKPDDCIRSAPATISKTVIDSLDTFLVTVAGKNERFLSDDTFRQQLGIDRVNRLLFAKLYATNKEEGDYPLEVALI